MKVTVKNLVKETVEFVECGYIKLDKERLIFIGSRVISILLPESTEREYLLKEIEKSFLNNQNLELTLNGKEMIIGKREMGGMIYGID